MHRTASCVVEFLEDWTFLWLWFTTNACSGLMRDTWRIQLVVLAEVYYIAYVIVGLLRFFTWRFCKDHSDQDQEQYFLNMRIGSIILRMDQVFFPFSCCQSLICPHFPLSNLEQISVRCLVNLGTCEVWLWGRLTGRSAPLGLLKHTLESCHPPIDPSFSPCNFVGSISIAICESSLKGITFT